MGKKRERCKGKKIGMSEGEAGRRRRCGREMGVRRGRDGGNKGIER